MRVFAEVVYVLLLGLGLGSWLSYASLQERSGIGAMTVGAWTAWPAAGSASADPYTTARVATEGSVPLGSAEGVEFRATRDSAREVLRRDCTYRVVGQTPLARLWTLTAVEPTTTSSRLPEGHPDTLSNITSLALLRDPSGAFDIEVGSSLRSGNWLPLDGSGPYSLVLRLYDSQVTTTASVSDPVLPRIERLGCRT